MPNTTQPVLVPSRAPGKQNAARNCTASDYIVVTNKQVVNLEDRYDIVVVGSRVDADAIYKHLHLPTDDTTLFLEHVSLVTLSRATHYVLPKTPLVLLGIEPSKKRHTSAMLSCVQAGAGRQARGGGRQEERVEWCRMWTDERIRRG